MFDLIAPWRACCAHPRASSTPEIWPQLFHHTTAQLVSCHATLGQPVLEKPDQPGLVTRGGALFHLLLDGSITAGEIFCALGDLGQTLLRSQIEVLTSGICVRATLGIIGSQPFHFVFFVICRGYRARLQTVPNESMQSGGRCMGMPIHVLVILNHVPFLLVRCSFGTVYHSIWSGTVLNHGPFFWGWL